MDPFSIATGAAGLVSLGLTASSGLIQYCNDYRSRDADLAQLAQHAQELNSFLALIESRATGPQSPNADINTSLQRCRDACDACLQDFKRLSDKHLKPSQTIKEPSRKLARNLKYPFDKRRYEDIRSRLQEFNTRLLGHLQLVNLDLTRDLRIQMISESARAATTVGHLEVSLQRGLQRTENNVVTSMAVGFNGLSDNFKGQQEQQTSIIMHRLDQVVQMLENRNPMQQALGIPEINSTRQYESAMREPPPRMPIKSILCDCPRARRGHGSSNMRHRKACPYSFNNREKRTFSWNFRALGRDIIMMCQLEYSPLAWARDWRIYPNLTLRAIVTSDAPTFKVIRRIDILHQAKHATIEEIKEGYRDCLVELQKVFADGRGWPTDALANGDNLIHMMMWYLLHYEGSIHDREDLISVWLPFITALVDMGVPINDLSEYMGSPLQQLLKYFLPHDTCIAHKFIDMGATIDNRYELFYTGILSILSLNITDLYEPIASTEFLREVLFRSESGVVCHLRTDTSRLREETRRGQTPFHLAVKWPRGLSILIEYAGETIQFMIDIKDCYGCTALNYAVRGSEPDSVRLLVDAGASLTPGILSEGAANDMDEARGEILCILTESLASRGQKLLELALQNLPFEAIEELGLEGGLPDHKAFDVVKTLRQRQVQIPAVYDTLRPGSVYHQVNLDSFLAQRLFDVGFHETNTKISGYTPLMTQYYSSSDLLDILEVVSWFEDHGADLHAAIPLPKSHIDTSGTEGIVPVYPVLHRIAYALGESAWLEPWEVTIEQLPGLARLFRDELQDPCLCYCTVGGCTSVSKYVQGLNSWLRDEHITEEELKRIRLVEQVTSDCDRNRVSLDVLRVITFDELGMRHTCCGYNYVYDPDDLFENREELLCLMDPGDVTEIREEDRYLAELLETLMEEFEAKFTEMDIPLIEFIEKYWGPRMEAVEQERDDLSADDLHAIREIGVVLDES